MAYREATMTLTEAEILAAKLTDMSTTGDDFLAGDIDGDIIIERYINDSGNIEDVVCKPMTIYEAVNYAYIVASDGITKCQMALELLKQYGRSVESVELLRQALCKTLEMTE